MNSEDILRMARKAGFAIDSLWMTYPSLALPVLLERFAAIVAAAERERCAKAVEIFDRTVQTGGGIAGSIRARGNE